MRKNLFFAGLLSFSVLAISSCSSDDNADAVNDQNMIAGTYNLTEVNTAEPTDFNLDGTENTNQVLESDCYDDARILLNADGTMTYHDNYILVDTGNGTSSCASASYSGTWEVYAQAGTSVSIMATYVMPNEEERTVNLTKVGNELTLTSLFTQYPDRDSSDAAVYTSGSVEWVFTK